MKKSSRFAAIGSIATLAVCGSAFAGWGLKFEVRRHNSDPWASSVNARALQGNVIKFRFGAYFDVDSPPAIVTPDGTGTARAFYRFTGSNQAVGFESGDAFQNMQRTLPNGNAALIQITGATIGGTGVTSFGAQLFLGPVPLEPYKEVYTGEVLLGPSATPRTITITNKTFGSASGSVKGLLFFNSVSPANKQTAAPQVDDHVNLEATIHVGIEDPCPPDLNFDDYVDDSDFVFFAAAYQLLSCDAPAMPAECPSDLNSDGLVDDLDFAVFATAYGELICP